MSRWKRRPSCGHSRNPRPVRNCAELAAYEQPRPFPERSRDAQLQRGSVVVPTAQSLGLRGVPDATQGRAGRDFPDRRPGVARFGPELQPSRREHRIFTFIELRA